MPSMITFERKEQLMSVTSSATRWATIEAVEELEANGVLTPSNFQRVLAQGDKMKAAIKATIMTTLAELAENVVGRLKRLFAERTIELRETDGKETLAEASDVFKAGIYGAIKRGVCKSTPKVLLAVYEMIKDGTYSQVFGGFGENLKRLCWTESQIVAFCRDHHDLLRKDGFGTFFLFEGKEGDLFVAHVDVSGDGHLNVDVRPLEYDHVWCAYYRHRIVVPQL